MTFGKSQPYACPACGVMFPNQASLANHGRYNKACTPETRFWARVHKRGPDDCWHWQGRKDASGYGRIARKGPMVYAHRVAWIFTNGPVPAGMDILHRCDQRDCCNPRHYFLGTQLDNNADMRAKGRHASKLTVEQVRAIKRELAEPHYRGKHKVLAEKYGISDAQISTIKVGRQWKHV